MTVGSSWVGRLLLNYLFYKEHDDEIEFKVYKSHKHGSQSGFSFSENGDPEVGSLSTCVEALDGALLETRNDAEDVDLAESDSESDSEEDE